MAAKKGGVEKALRKAQSVLASYIKPGRRSAEATIDELLKVLGKARGVLRAIPRARRKRRTTRARRAAAGRAAAARRTNGATKRKATVRRRKARAAR
jgi:hypothetical protein